MVQLENNKHKHNNKRSNKNKFFINDQTDLLIEILKRLDDDSLGEATCVGGGTAGVLEDVNGIREAGGESEEGKSLDEARGRVVAIAVLR
ncbi:hypothetical protein LguiA_034881 [Lonicera macranthoides]